MQQKKVSNGAAVWQRAVREGWERDTWTGARMEWRSEPCKHLGSFPGKQNRKCKGPEEGMCSMCLRNSYEATVVGGRWTRERAVGGSGGILESKATGGTLSCLLRVVGSHQKVFRRAVSYLTYSLWWVIPAAMWKRDSRRMSVKAEKRKENAFIPFPHGTQRFLLALEREHRYKDYQYQTAPFIPVHSTRYVTSIQLVGPGNETAITYLT